ncbi:hypothetical protein MMC09_003951 [Bachmanniomyces sp. S44760]|nr:hypothetical protein [Bachmanniomyces sp. S44760]
MTTKTLLISGATGQQGGGVIKALIANTSNPPPFKILALTRNPDSTSAKKLTSLSPTITLLKGDLNDCASVFKSANTPIWGVFSVQQFMGGGASLESEERQGKALIDAALDAKVSHFVYSSVERRHDANGQDDETPIPHYATKHRIEQYLKSKVAAPNPQSQSTTYDNDNNNENKDKTNPPMTYTILRPTGFMENFTPGTFGTITATALKATQTPTSKTYWIATSDIGHFGAQALLHPHDPIYHNTAVPLAGDVLTYAGIVDAFRSATGKPPPTTYTLPVKAFLYFNKEFGSMFRWFADVGNKVDVERCREIYPGVMDLRTWIAGQEGYVGKK